MYAWFLGDDTLADIAETQLVGLVLVKELWEFQCFSHNPFKCDIMSSTMESADSLCTILHGALTIYSEHILLGGSMVAEDKSWWH